MIITAELAPVTYSSNYLHAAAHKYSFKQTNKKETASIKGENAFFFFTSYTGLTIQACKSCDASLEIWDTG